jgi:hypothetical protein
MTRKEYLEKEIAKYRGYIILFTLGYIAAIIISIFLVGYFIVFWWTNDSLSVLQVLKKIICKFWYLYMYTIFIEFIRSSKMRDVVCVYRSFKRQLTEVEDGDDA